MLLLTEPKHPPRSGPPSAFYEPGRGNLLAEALLARGHRVVMWWDHPVGPMVPADPGVVALRSSHPVQLARAEVFARMGVPVVNDPVAHRRARDKLHQHEVLGAAGLLVPETTGARTATARWHGNDLVVVKPRVGTSGRSVRRGRWGVMAPEVGPDDLVQRFVDAEVELRATVVRSRYGSVPLVNWSRRRAAPGDFRANLAQGGSMEEYGPVDPAVDEAAVAAVELLGLQVGGVDVLLTSSGPVILEVNAATTLHGPTRVATEHVVAAVCDVLVDESTPPGPGSGPTAVLAPGHP